VKTPAIGGELMFRYLVLSLAIPMLVAGATIFGPGAFGDEQPGDEIPDSPCKCTFKPVPNIAGDYAGPIDDAANGTGTLTVTLTQHRAHVDGTWATTYSNGQGDNGAVIGTVKQKVVKLQLFTSEKNCKYHGLASIGSDSLQGALISSPRCTTDNSGNFTLNKK
jgi:hypothetical protein